MMHGPMNVNFQTNVYAMSVRPSFRVEHIGSLLKDYRKRLCWRVLIKSANKLKFD